MNPVISVCVPVYNTAQYLEQCLESIFNQTIADKCEFIIVNDCSPDNSAEILQALKNKYANLPIKIITHERNRGLAAARNTGLENSTGTYCIFLDSDDWCEHNYIERMLSVAKDNAADMVVSFCDNYKPSNNDFIYQILMHELPIVIWAKLIKRTLFTENNLKWVEGINVGEDVIISSKLLFFAKKVITIPDRLYHYRVSIGFVTKLKKIAWLEQKKKQFAELERFFNENNCYEKYREIIDLRKAEIKFDFIKAGTSFSIKKYNIYYPEIKLEILLKLRSDLNNRQTKLFISLVDKKKYFSANILLLFYKLYHLVIK